MAEKQERLKRARQEAASGIGDSLGQLIPGKSVKGTDEKVREQKLQREQQELVAARKEVEALFKEEFKRVQKQVAAGQISSENPPQVSPEVRKRYAEIRKKYPTIPREILGSISGQQDRLTNLIVPSAKKMTAAQELAEAFPDFTKPPTEAQRNRSFALALGVTDDEAGRFLAGEKVNLPSPVAEPNMLQNRKDAEKKLEELKQQEAQI